jgi:hypothetical protein
MNPLRTRQYQLTVDTAGNDKECKILIHPCHKKFGMDEPTAF